MAGDAGKHRGAEFNGIVECEHEIRITIPGENAVGCSALSLDPPADAQQRGFDAPCFG
jgi:hypothetical protein